jgi:hypothetical protein
MGMIAAHFTLIYVTLQTSGDSTRMGGDGHLVQAYLRDIAVGEVRGVPGE